MTSCRLTSSGTILRSAILPLDVVSLYVVSRNVVLALWLCAMAPVALAQAVDSASVDSRWILQALARPADARNRVLVALERNTVTGFLVTGPASDPDCDPVSTGELTDLTVDPHKRRAGHGSRLLQAGADTLVADRFVRAVTWLPAADDTMRAFLTDAGWGADGAHRTLDLLGDGTTTLKQVRLHTALVDPS